MFNYILHLQRTMSPFYYSLFCAKKKFFCLTIVSVFLLSSSASPAHSFSIKEIRPTNDDTHAIPRKAHFCHELISDIGLQATAPFKMNLRQSFYFIGGVAATLALIHYDHTINKNVSPLKGKNRLVNVTSPVLTEFGGAYGFLGVGLFVGYSFLFHNEKAKETSRLLAEALITSTVWTQFGKMVSGRERPSDSYYGNARGHINEWYGPVSHLDRDAANLPPSAFDAFPSGHTTTAFAIATVFANQYGDHRAVPYIAYTLASAVGFTRMTQHAHWASDVFAGACLGYLCGRQVCVHHHLSAASTATLKSIRKRISPLYFLNYADRKFYAGCSLQLY